MGYKDDIQISPEVSTLIECELMCPFCESSAFSVETTVIGGCTCDHYDCTCGNSWDVLNR
jgi:hypothetical protein